MFWQAGNYLHDPIFLKASECLDIHAAGSLSRFTVLMLDEDVEIDSTGDIRVGNDGKIKVLSKREGAFKPFDAQMLKDLYARLSVEEEREGDDEENSEEDYVMTAQEFREDHRLYLKQHKNARIVLLSVCCPGNIQRLTESIRGDKSEQRAVKVTKSIIDHASGVRCTRFLRVCVTGSSSMEICPEISLLQVEDGNGDFFLASPSHAMVVYGGRLFKLDASRFNYAEVLERFNDGSPVLDHLDAMLPEDGREELAVEEDPEKLTETRPVVVLQKKQIRIDLLSRLSDCTRQLIEESKSVAPTKCNLAQPLTRADGSAFKHASRVYGGYMKSPSYLSGCKISVVEITS